MGGKACCDATIVHPSTLCMTLILWISLRMSVGADTMVLASVQLRKLMGGKACCAATTVHPSSLCMTLILLISSLSLGMSVGADTCCL